MILCRPKMFSSKPCETGRTLLALRHYLGASAARGFRAQNPGAPLPLRARVDTEDSVVVAGSDVGSDGARRREMVRDVIVRSTGAEADVSAGPIVVRHLKRRWRRVRQVCRYCRPCDHRRKRQARKKEISHDGRSEPAVGDLT
jgi:hypothetical protein